MNDPRFFSLSLVVGSLACNARCPFCVAGMTPTSGMGNRLVPFDQVALDTVAAFAASRGAGQVVITGKGEPTLWPGEIEACLATLLPHGFAAIDLQTNGITIADGAISPEKLRGWRQAGLDLVSISVAHHARDRNREIYTPYRDHYIDLAAVIDRIHDAGMKARLALVMIGGFIDSAPSFVRFLAAARTMGADQVTARPVSAPLISRSDAIGAYVAKHRLSDSQQAAIANVMAGAPVLCRLPGGSVIYDLDGTSVCLATCLTREDPRIEIVRHLIVYPDGSVATSWEIDSRPLDEIT